MEFIMNLFMIFVLSATLVHSQSQLGFISIDCGSSKNFYKDTDTGITYSDDEACIATGVNANISSEYSYPKNPVLPFPLSDLRAFPIGIKNCYSLKPDGGAGTLNLVRATFLYGNYDGKDSPPEFDLYLDSTLWTAVKLRNSSETVATEILATATSETVKVCLVNKGSGIPFGSALELRPVNRSVYVTEEGDEASLVLFRRLDLGAKNLTGRYADDVYDRIWSRFYSSASSDGWDSIRTSSDVNNYENGYRVPQEVIKTAARSETLARPLEIEWEASDPRSEYYVFLHFAEIEKLERNQTRKFEVTWNGNRVFGSAVSPRYLYATTVSNSKALVGKDHRISLRATGDSTLPPILNGVEVFEVRRRD